MKKITIFIFVLALPLCNLVYSQVKTFTGIDTNITLQAGEKFDIKLSSNTSTGYSWHAVNDYKNIVSSGGREYISPADGKMGSSGEELFHFDALQTGEAKLKFFYSRSTDITNEADIITFTISVK